MMQIVHDLIRKVSTGVIGYLVVIDLIEGTYLIHQSQYLPNIDTIPIFRNNGDTPIEVAILTGIHRYFGDAYYVWEVENRLLDIINDGDFVCDVVMRIQEFSSQSEINLLCEADIILAKTILADIEAFYDLAIEYNIF